MKIGYCTVELPLSIFFAAHFRTNGLLNIDKKVMQSDVRVKHSFERCRKGCPPVQVRENTRWSFIIWRRCYLVANVMS